MHKNATKCNKTQSKWCKNKHGASQITDTFETYQAPPCREKKEEPELLEETRQWWVEPREMLAKLSRHPDDPADAPGLALAVAHSLAEEADGAAGEATTRKTAIGSTTTHSALNMWCAAGIYP
jgi:hypothetical protein